MTNLVWLWVVTASLFGLNIGSFLNVVIWRIPRGQSLISPQFSYCPHCKRRLTGIDLIPLFSFLLLGRRCRTCKKPISWRYFSVELLTAVLFLALALRFQHNVPDAVSLMLFAALLVPMTFIDLEFFAIPIQLNLLAFLVAVGRDAWGILHHEPGHALLWGWLPLSLAGAVVGILIFGSVRLAGWIWKRREAMGLGDVLLARAMGAVLVQLVPAGAPILRLFPAWVLLSCVSGMIVGIPLIWYRIRAEAAGGTAGQGQSGKGTEQKEAEEEEPDDEPTTLREQLLDIGYCFALADLFEYLRFTLGARNGAGSPEPEPTIAEEEFTPQPTAIPFGPFLAVGFLATVLVGEALTAWYLAVALPKPEMAVPGVARLALSRQLPANHRGFTIRHGNFPHAEQD